MAWFDFLRPAKTPAPAPVSAGTMEAQALELIEAGNRLEDAGRLDEARQRYLKALELAPELPQAHLNLGNVLLAKGEKKAAVEAYGAALRHKPDYAGAHFNLGNAQVALRQFAAAARSYEAALALRPDSANAWVGLGYAQHELGRLKEALESYDRALELRPDYAEVYNNRGLTYVWLEQHAAALENYDRAIALRPDYAEAYYNRGLALIQLNQRAAAVDSFDRVLALDPDHGFTYGLRLHAKMHICDWRDHEAEVQTLLARIERGLRSTSTFSLLGLTGSARHQQLAAQLWTQQKYPADPALGPLPAPRAGRKIRIGYISRDFCNHPVSFLTAGVFEAHDRSEFEIVAFAYGPDIRDEMRARLEPAFDRFIRINDRSDEEVAQLARDIGIDIAVDLGGHTTEARTGIFALRAAPIQVNYLGYPGTMGADYIDYIIGDETLIPPEHRGWCTEKVVYLPCYQANDAKRAPVVDKFGRQDLRLPESGFVFCCFNNTYKITPGVFDSWMRILRQVDGSVLFLFADTLVAQQNLKEQAARRGVASHRLVFGDRLALPDYMARYRAADLFLDTLPFNAGTTASDALWAGLPVLTCTGEAFASRMAASLLTALDLPELITSDLAEYEARAVALARDPARLAELRQRLAIGRSTSILFDTEYFTRQLEAAYRQMVALHRGGQLPQHIDVRRSG